jgi:tripartite-type tricarboxylate transporter receptor subunit TctC
MRRFSRRSVVGAVLAFAAAASWAQAYPSRPITLIVPFPAGGVTDVIGRAVASRLGAELGQTVVVENKAGASGTVGTEIASRAAPDGYTLLLANTSTLGTNAATFAKLPYDPVAGFTPISLLAVQPLVIAVHPSVPAQNLAQLVQLAKAKPGVLTYGTAGSSIHLAVELFNSLNGIKMLYVPYKGSAPAITDLIGGQVNVLFDPISTLYPQVKSGKVRGLAVTTATRSPTAPQLPTVSESGTKGYDVSSWQALVAPAGTPAAIIERLNAAVVKVLALPATKEQFGKLGVQPSPTTPAAAGQHIRSEIALWKKVAHDAGVEPQ